MGDRSTELDELIVRAAGADGDRSALEALLVHFHDPLLRFIARLVGRDNAHIAADDVLQDTMVAAFRAIGNLRPCGGVAFFTWLKIIARSQFLNQIQAQGALKRGGSGGGQTGPRRLATSILDLIAVRDPSVSQMLRRKEAVEAMQRAIAQLHARKRQALELRYGQQLSIQAVAAHTGKTEAAVKMLINRAIKELRQSMASVGEFSVGM
jgi:RNA polymerase sigma-70 factor (ECF subfamily)